MMAHWWEEEDLMSTNIKLRPTPGHNKFNDQ